MPIFWNEGEKKMKKQCVIFAVAVILGAGTILSGDDNLLQDISRFESNPNAAKKENGIKGWEITGFKYSVKDDEGKQVIEAEPLPGDNIRHWFLTRINQPRPGKYVFSIKVWSDRILDQMSLFRYYVDPAGKGQCQQQDFFGKTLAAPDQWKTLTTVLDFPQDTKSVMLVFQIFHEKSDYHIHFSDPVLRKLEDKQ